MALHRNRRYEIGFDPNRPLPPVKSPPTLDRRLCRRTLLASLEAGLRDQSLVVASIAPAGMVDGTLRAAMEHLVDTLKRKGFVITD